MRCRNSGALRHVLWAAVLACSIGGGSSALAGEPDIPLGSVVGIRVEGPGDDVVEGMGVYVGEGRVWTAAHVVSDVAAGASLAIITAGDDGLYGERLDAVIHRIDARRDAAVIHVANAARLTPLAPCARPAVGDRVHIARLVPLREPPLDEPLFALELEERAFIAAKDGPAPVIPGVVQFGDSGGPVLAGDGRCFFSIVSGSLVHTVHTKGAIRRLAHVVLIEPVVFRPLQ